jgi:protein-histidine pros-kinase
MRSSPEQRLRDLLDAAPNAIIEVDEGGRIMMLDGMTEKLFGYERAELIGQTIELLIPEQYREYHVHHRRTYLAQPITRAMGAPAMCSKARRASMRQPLIRDGNDS